MTTRGGGYSVNTLQELLKIRSRLQEKLARNSDYRALTAVERAIAELNADVIALPAPAHLSGISITPHRPGSHADAVAQILSERGQPLTMRELLGRLRQKGVKFIGKHPKLSLSATLSRSRQFRSVSFEGVRSWWFCGRPIPESGRLVDAKNEMPRLPH
jgi:hypothetical protein